MDNDFRQFRLLYGAWRIVMTNSDEVDFHNRSEFVEVVKPEKIVYVHLEPIHRFTMSMSFDDVPKGRTKLTWRMMMERTPENEQIEQFIALANEENFDRLAGFLRSQKR